MPDSARPLEPERLLAEMDWARRLARALVGELAADDVTQEALRIALEKPPELEPGTSLRAWLRGVIANLARGQKERGVRRRYHEQRAARAESVEPELAGFERVLEQRQLADAVLALDEPYRSAIALRYFDDLSPREVAARQDITYEAARQRLSRGLAHLRTRLAREDGSHRRNWMLLAALPAPSRILATGLGGAWMSGKLVLASAAILIVLGGWWWRERPTFEPAPGAPALSAGAHDSESQLDSTMHAPASSNSTRVEAPVPDSTVDGGAPAALDRELALSGIVVDPAGKPIAGAEIRVRRNPLDEISVLDLAHSGNSYAVAEARTDASGEFSLPVPQGRTLELLAASAGFAEFSLAHCHAGEYVTIALQPAAVVHGRVTRATDGTFVAEARVQISPRDSSALPNVGATRSGTTNARGEYRLEGVAVGRYSMRVSPLSESIALSETFEISGGQELRKDFVVEPGHTLRGRVTEAKTGVPIVGARVGEGWTASRSVTTDANGDYVFEGFSTQGYYEIDVTARGYGRKGVTVREPDGPFPERLDVELEPARALAGRVLDTSGAPIEGAYVAAVAYDINGVDGHDWESALTSADGRFEISTLAPGQHHTLWIRREDYGSFLRQLPAREIDTPRLDVGDVVMLRGSSVFGTVVDDASQPVPGMTVELDGNGSEFNAWEPQTFGHAARLYLGQRATRCDDLGRFSFSDLSPGTYELVALRVDSHDRTSVTVQVGKEETVRDTVLVVARGLSISGRVRDSSGEAISAYVSVDPEDPELATNGDVHDEADGSFRVAGLAPGSYSLTIYPESLWRKDTAGEGERHVRFVVRGVAAGRSEVDVVVPRAAPIRGRVLDAAGTPIAGAVVSVLAEDEDTSVVSCNADGSFVLWVQEGVPCDLHVDPRPALRPGRGRIAIQDPSGSPAGPVRRAVIGGGEPLEIRMP